MSKPNLAMDALSNKVDELMDRIHFFLAEDLGPVKVSQGLLLSRHTGKPVWLYFEG